MFSVVLPTLQRSPLLGPLVELYAEHDLVAEVLVVNNAEQPLRFASPRVRVLQQQTNLLVNPSWNLGAAEATGSHLVVSNDDVLFPPALLDAVGLRLGVGARRPRDVGMVGPHTSCLRPGSSRRPTFVPAYERKPGYGVLFFLERARWVPIPDDLLIWCGDDWQFSRQTSRNLYFVGTRVQTTIGTTSGSPEFAAQKQADLATWTARYADSSPYLRRFGREARAVRGALALGHRMTDR